jgi:hypothetical protein
MMLNWHGMEHCGNEGCGQCGPLPKEPEMTTNPQDIDALMRVLLKDEKIKDGYEIGYRQGYDKGYDDRDYHLAGQVDETAISAARSEGFREGEAFCLLQVEKMADEVHFAKSGHRESDMDFGIRVGRKRALWDVVEKLKGAK